MSTTQQSSLPVRNDLGDVYTRFTGCPIANNLFSLSAGALGPVMLQDAVLIEKCKQFCREKTPPRNVHALGHGAFGKFTATNDVTNHTRAALFKKGTVTEIAVRFSGVFTELGEATTNRDPRGFALKFYTSEGNYDLLTINLPVFQSRDMKVGPDSIHAFKRDPRTGEWNGDQFWDFVATHPEGLHAALMVFTDRVGTPASYRAMNCFGCNTFSFWNEKMERFWVKFHIVSELGWKGLSVEDAKILSGEEPDFLGKDLRDAIKSGNFPKYKLSYQVMSEEDGYKLPFAFDCTKTWPHDQFPLIELGNIVLDRNPTNYHAEFEQITFSPMTLVPGIGVSPDKLLQGRLLIYDDTQHHRLGANKHQIPVNTPLGVHDHHYWNPGGPQNMDSTAIFPHYYPNTYSTMHPDPQYREPPMRCTGPVDYYAYPGAGTDEDYYGQAIEFVKSLPPSEFANLGKNIAGGVYKCNKKIVDNLMPHLQKVSPQLAQLVATSLANDRKDAKTANEIRATQLLMEMKNMPKEKALV